VAERFAVTSSTGQPGRVNRDGIDLADRLRSKIGKRKLPELAIGLALLVFGLIGAVILRNGGESGVEIIVASNNIEAGHVFGTSDFATIRVPNEIHRLFVLASDARELIGQRALTDTQAGSPIMSAGDAAGEPLSSTEMLTAVLVRSGSYPPNLRIGSKVLVVVVPDPTTTNGSTPYVFGKPVSIWSMDASVDDPTTSIVTLRGDRDLFLATSGALEIRLALLGDSIEEVTQ
jgi:SAF domain